MKFLVTVKQTFYRTATIEVEAKNDLAAMDIVDHIPENEIRWSDLEACDPEAIDAKLIDTRST